jgi:ABC-type phosphate/phosphonate transport system substrate-binding protein
MKSIVPRFFMLILAMVLVLSGVPRLSGGEERSLTLGVLAIRPKQETITRWQPLANYLSEKLDNHQVRLLALDHAELQHALEAKQVDLVFTNPVHFIILSQQNRLTGALATLELEEQGMPLSTFGGGDLYPCQPE